MRCYNCSSEKNLNKGTIDDLILYAESIQKLSGTPARNIMPQLEFYLTNEIIQAW